MFHRRDLFNNMQVKLFAYKIPFKTSMQFKQYSLGYREGLILQIKDKKGRYEFAEVAPLPGFSRESLAQVQAQMIALLSNKPMHLHSHIYDDTVNDGNGSDYDCGNYNSLEFALDSLHVNKGIDTTAPLANIDNIPLLQGLPSTIAPQYQALGSPNKVKLKVARDSIKSDISSFQALCQLNSQLKIRCDANQAWSKQKAEQFFCAINIDQLDYIEEPTSNHQTNLQLAEQYKFNLGLDETLQQPNFNYAHHPSISAFIIKPTLIGNKQKIDKLVSHASEFAIKISFSSCFESIVGLQQLKNLANSYLTEQKYQDLDISLGIDTLKYFDSTLLQNMNNVEQDCQRLELLWTSN